MKRNVILYIAVSLDGYIADREGGVGWLDAFSGCDCGYNEFLEGVDTVLIGMRTYLQIINTLSPGIWPYRGLKSYVFTRRKMRSTELIEFVSEDPAAFVRRLRGQEGKGIWVCGGADLAGQLVRADEIDEYQLSVMPLLLGGGIRLFDGGISSLPLKLERLSSSAGAVHAVYSRRKMPEKTKDFLI